MLSVGDFALTKAPLIAKMDCSILREDQNAKGRYCGTKALSLLQCLPVGAPCLGYVDNDLATG